MAHRFLLESRCEYFKAMFRSGMSEGGQAAVLDVVVPDTFVGFLRLLIFLYTNTLPDASDGALLEDLMAADRYAISDMRLLSENMLIPSKSNWLDFLRTAELLSSSRLRVMVVSFLRDNVTILHEVFGEEACAAVVSGTASVDAGLGSSASSVSSLSSSSQAVGSSVGGSNEKEKEREKEKMRQKKMARKREWKQKGGSSMSGSGSIVPSDLDEFREEFPGLLEEIFSRSAVMRPPPPSAILIDQIVKATDKDLANSAKDDPTFPLWSLILLAVATYVYSRISTVIVLGPLVPVINGITAVLAFIYMLYFMAYH